MLPASTIIDSNFLESAEAPSTTRDFDALEAAKEPFMRQATALTIEDMKQEVREQLVAEAVTAEVIQVEDHSSSSGGTNRCKRQRLYALLAILLLAVFGALVGAVIVVVTEPDNENPAPRNGPPRAPFAKEQLELKTFLLEQSQEGVLDDPTQQ
jgi:hypothetical protein